ncbi:hypothetical protein F4604DRAFT_1673763 [Suillus subluteus]|nr:hypothetical protein F4604DRAFT_1673763 [Suillus subluteus]
MKDQSTVKIANVSARPSPMGTCQPLPRPHRSGSQFFPLNVLNDEGESMESLSLPPSPSPNPRPSPPSLPNVNPESGTPVSPTPAPPPVEAEETNPGKELIIEDLSNSIHAPKNDDDATMSDNPPPSYPPTCTCTSPPEPAAPTEEDLIRAHLAVAETNCSIVKISGANSLNSPPSRWEGSHRSTSHTPPNSLTSKPQKSSQVFDHDGKNPSVKGPILVERLRKAITDIAQSTHQDDQEIKVSPPCPEATKEEEEHPLSFLTYNISAKTKEIILAQRIWSSPDITFAAHQFSVNTPPLLLFCLQGFSTMDTTIVKRAVFETWSNEPTCWDIVEILAESDIPVEESFNAMREFIKTLWVEHLDFKASGGIPLPRYNIFAASPTSTPAIWTKLRAYLHSLTYPSELEGNGKAANFILCQLCHSIAHPHGLCPFPDVPLWNGPKHQNSRTPAYNQRGRGQGRKPQF